MLLDGTGWHRSGNLEIPSNTTLIYKPSHGPAINLVMNTWDKLREKHLPNETFRSPDEVDRSLFEGLPEFRQDPERLRSMTDFECLKVLD